MKFLHLSLLTLKFVSVFAQEVEEPEIVEEKGAGLVPPNGLEGIYEVTYYYNAQTYNSGLDSTQKNKPLKCKASEPFKIQLVSGDGNIIVTHKEGKSDPIYNTKLSTWELKELKNEGGVLATTFKFNIWENDERPVIACWRVGFSSENKDDLVFAMTPGSSKHCPFRFSSNYLGCTPGLNFAHARCIEGECKNRGKPGEVINSFGSIIQVPFILSISLSLIYTLIY